MKVWTVSNNGMVAYVGDSKKKAEAFKKTLMQLGGLLSNEILIQELEVQ
jgi:hypothetical protein